jgi:hypothetical protein
MFLKIANRKPQQKPSLSFGLEMKFRLNQTEIMTFPTFEIKGNKNFEPHKKTRKMLLITNEIFNNRKQI